MIRTVIHYGAQEYVVGQDIGELRSAIRDILASGEPGWLVVNHGRGILRRAELLITQGVAVGLVDSNDPSELD